MTDGLWPGCAYVEQSGTWAAAGEWIALFQPCCRHPGQWNLGNGSAQCFYNRASSNTKSVAMLSEIIHATEYTSFLLLNVGHRVWFGWGSRHSISLGMYPTIISILKLLPQLLKVNWLPCADCNRNEHFVRQSSGSVDHGRPTHFIYRRPRKQTLSKCLYFMIISCV